VNSNFAAVSQGPSGEWKGGCDVGADFGGCGMVGERMAVWPFPLFLSRWRLGTPADRAGRVDVWGGVRDGSSSRSGGTDIDCSFGISSLLQDLHEEASRVI